MFPQRRLPNISPHLAIAAFRKRVPSCVLCADRCSKAPHGAPSYQHLAHSANVAFKTFRGYHTSAPQNTYRALPYKNLSEMVNYMITDEDATRTVNVTKPPKFAIAEVGPHLKFIAIKPR
jgi:hypothetical protein